ncbi:MAG: NUDIX domain-containing protein [Anaerolineae bacterium]|jgi:ADP-ribose pyrophosphatase YjhB (NUDIX family)|nr:NUDIX domain-containing protein [Anaerolineae bacterium]
MTLAHIVVTVLVFIEQEGQLLLVQQNYGARYWSLPGGVMEAGESIDQTAIREVKEETGLDIRLKRIVALYSKPRENGLAVCFAGEVTGGVLAPDNEIIACGYFSPAALPEPVRPHLRQRIEDYRYPADAPPRDCIFRTQ